MAFCLDFFATNYVKNGVICFINIVNIDKLTLNMDAGVNCRLEQEKKERTIV